MDNRTQAVLLTVVPVLSINQGMVLISLGSEVVVVQVLLDVGVVVDLDAGSVTKVVNELGEAITDNSVGDPVGGLDGDDEDVALAGDIECVLLEVTTGLVVGDEVERHVSLPVGVDCGVG